MDGWRLQFPINLFLSLSLSVFLSLSFILSSDWEKKATPNQDYYITEKYNFFGTKLPVGHDRLKANCITNAFQLSFDFKLVGVSVKSNKSFEAGLQSREKSPYE